MLLDKPCEPLRSSVEILAARYRFRARYTARQFGFLGK